MVLCKLVQYIGFVYTCTVNWFCVNLYSELVIYTLVQLYRNWFCKLAFLAMKATLEVQKAMFLSKFAQILQFINSLSTSKSNLSWAAHKTLRSACFSRGLDEKVLGVRPDLETPPGDFFFNSSESVFWVKKSRWFFVTQGGSEEVWHLSQNKMKYFVLGQYD